MRKYGLARVLPFIAVALACMYVMFSLLTSYASGPLRELNASADRRARYSSADTARLEAYLGLDLGAAQETNLTNFQPVTAPQNAPQSATSPNPSGYAMAATAFRRDRMIVKNGSMQMLVADVETTVNQITQLTVGYDGYIVNARVWSAVWEEQSYQHATLTIAVPSERFEEAMGQLRHLALQVLDENAGGQDVTEEYVDLESSLRNLQATRDRVLTFLEQAEDAAQALSVNRTLQDLEAEIEQTQGRMLYLQDRSAYSTITLQIDEQPRPAEPLPLEPNWNPGATARHALDTLRTLGQGVIDFIIWTGIVALPFGVPVALLGWGVWRWRKAKSKAGTATKA